MTFQIMIPLIAIKPLEYDRTGDKETSKSEAINSSRKDGDVISCGDDTNIDSFLDFEFIFSSSCQRQCELLPSLVVH